MAPSKTRSTAPGPRFRRGFERVGRRSLAAGRLPDRRRRELLLIHAWQSVAGEPVARRAVAERVRRGVLEIHVAEHGWAAALRPLLPAAVGRLAARYPELGVRRFRLRIAADPPSEPLAAQSAPATEEPAGPRPDAPGPAPRAAGRSLVELAERYVRRAARRRAPAEPPDR